MSNLSKLAMALGLKFGPVRKGVTPRRVLEFVLNDMIMVQADAAIATDHDVITRHSGMMEAYKNVAHFIAPSTAVAAKSTRAAKAATNGIRTAAGK